MSNLKNNTVRNYSSAGIVILLLMIAVMIFRPLETTVVEIILLLAGITFGSLLFRFEMPKGWITIAALVLFWGLLFLSGPQGLGWIAGFLAGSNFGVAWRAAVAPKKPSAPWIVNNQGFDTVTDAGAAAHGALKDLDGSSKNWRLSIENEFSRFDASGSSKIGLLCHRALFGKKKYPWSILEHPERADEEIEIPMGPGIGYIPSEFSSTLIEAEAALNEFLKNPKTKNLGPEWNSKEIAETLHLN